MRSLFFALAFAAGCSFSVEPLNNDLAAAADLATPGGGDSGPSQEDLSGTSGDLPVVDMAMAPVDMAMLQPDLRPPPVVFMMSDEAITSPTNVDLTSEGTIDWRKCGYNTGAGASASSIHKLLSITSPLTDPVGAVGAYDQNSPEIVYKWSDGDLNKMSSVGDQTFVYVQNQNATITFTAQASTSPQVLRVYIASYDAAGTFSATLDGQTKMVNVAKQNNARNSHRIVVKFQADANKTLSLTWKRTDSGGSSAGIDIGGYTLGSN